MEAKVRTTRAQVFGAALVFWAVVGLGCDDDPAPPAPVDAAAGDAGGADVPMVMEAGQPDAVADVTAPPDLPAFSAGTVNLVGRVVSAGAAAAPIAQAKVTASIDRDHDGTIELAEEVVGMSGVDGQFALDVTVMPGEVLVVKIEKELIAPILRTIQVAGGAQIALEVAAAALEPLTCAGGKCTSADGALAIEGMPSWASAVGAAFNPVTDTAQFPGAFEDSTGALLKSAAFAAIELRDAQGAKIQALPMPASLRLQIPPDTHVLVEDMKPGTDRIEVPMYAFNEVTGTWVADGEAHLENANGVPLAEAALAQLKAGAMASTAVFARGQITHASYWNIDWPLRTHGCLSGTVVDAAGMPVFGATLFAGGVGYTGSYRPITTGANGRFCLDVQRAEAAEEDIDGDLVRGEKNLVSLHVQAGGHNYLLGAFAPAALEATCGGSCTDLGALVLAAEKEVKVALEGHWGGDWGEMLLRKVGDEIWGSYTHDQGTVVLRPSPDGVYRGWWSEAPSRMASADAGEVEFRFIWKDTQLTLDGRWRYGESGAFREDWDLSHLTTPVPPALEARFTDATAFRRHP